MVITIKLVFLFLISIGLIHYLIQLAHRKHWHHPIYDLSPDSHQSKIHTPAIGGIAIACHTIIGCGLFWNDMSPRLWWLLLVMGLFSLIGLVDDMISMTSARNQGLSARQKLMMQIYFSLLCLIIYGIYIQPISIAQGLFYSIVMVGTSNATNLTDGLDGLLGGTMIISLMGLAMMGWLHLGIDVTTFIAILICGLAAFLLFNVYPAKVFMGDTGSLSLGAVLTGIAIIYGNIWILLPLGCVYIIETVSVILQVGWYKRTQTRLFLMAPLHHHFEKLGLKEPYIVTMFYVIGILGVIIGLLTTTFP